MSVNDDYLTGCDVLGAINLTRSATVKVTPVTEVAPTATMTARSAAMQEVAPTTTMTSRAATMRDEAPTSRAARTLTRDASGKVLGRSVQRSQRREAAPVVVLPRSAAAAAAQATVPSADSASAAATGTIAAGNRIAAAGQKLLTLQISSKRRAGAARFAKSLIAAGTKTAKHSADKVSKLSTMAAKLRPTAKPSASAVKAKSTRVHGPDDPSSAKTVAMSTISVETMQLFLQIRLISEAIATVAENGTKLTSLVSQLDTAGGKVDVANAGQAIVDRAQKLTDEFNSENYPYGVWSDGAPIDSWGVTARAINADADTWVVAAQAALAPAPPAADGSNPAWAPSTAYTSGAQVTASGNLYTCITAGTSGTTAPTGFGKSVTDGTVVWAYAGAAPPPPGSTGGGGGGSSGGGGGGGGGGEEGGGGGEEGGGGGEEAPPGGGEEGAPEGGEGGAPPLEEQMYEEAYGRPYDGQPSGEQPDVEAQLSAADQPDAAQPEAEQPAQTEDVSGDDVLPFVVKSELPKVSDEAWTRFALAMRTAQPGAVSKSNALGMFEMKPRRLADLDLVINLSCSRSKDGRVIWVGEFIPPLTAKMFLTDPNLQYVTFVKSMKNYVDGLRSGTIPKPDGGKPAGASLSGVLAILHRAGPKGLKNWNDESSRFEETETLYDKVNGIF